MNPLFGLKGNVVGPGNLLDTNAIWLTRQPQLYVMTYSTRRWWWPFRIRHTWEKVCTWDEALAMQAQIRVIGITDCEVTRG